MEQDNTRPARRFRHRKLAVVLALCLVIMVAGTAYALWSASGDGTGTASALTAQTSVIAGGSAAADLYPGGRGDIAFRITNPNPYAVLFDSGTILGIASSNEAACPRANLSAVSPASALSLTVPANTTAATAGSWNDAVQLSVDAPDGCQGVTFSITLRLTGSQTS